MIRDAQGRKWFLRFKHYTNGWFWDARCEHTNSGQQASKMFKTKAAAERNARKKIQSWDAIGFSRDYWARLGQRGTVCRLSGEDMNAIQRAGKNQ